jgi:hypothetical protein
VVPVVIVDGRVAVVVVSPTTPHEETNAGTAQNAAARDRRTNNDPRELAAGRLLLVHNDGFELGVVDLHLEERQGAALVLLAVRTAQASLVSRWRLVKRDESHMRIGEGKMSKSKTGGEEDPPSVE